MMRRLLLIASLAALCAPAFAQEGRYVDPQPVNFDAPFQFDGLRVRDGLEAGGGEEARPRSVGVPIEQWLANGRKLEGLRPPAPPRQTLDVLDGRRLQELFKDLLPVETPGEKAPSPAR